MHVVRNFFYFRIDLPPVVKDIKLESFLKKTLFREKDRSWALCEKCPNNRVSSGPYFPVFGLNTEIYSVNLRFQSKYRKYGPETPYLDTFHAVAIIEGANRRLFKVNGSRYTALFVVSVSIKNVFLNWLCQYLSFLSILFNRFCPVVKCGVTPHCLYHDSLTLKIEADWNTCVDQNLSSLGMDPFIGH